MSRRDAFYLTAALAILALPFLLGILSSAIDDDRPTPTPSIPVPDYTLADCLAGPPEAYITMTVSPNGRFCAINHNNFMLIIVDADGRQGSWYWMKWLHVIGWTADSRFVVFSPYDQYGNRTTQVFDTARWQAQSLFDDDSCFGNMSGACQAGVTTIAPVSSRLLLANGQLHTPDSDSHHPLPAPAELQFVPAAAWSPDESRLAYFAAADTYPDADNRAALWVGDGNGRDAKRIELALALSTAWNSTLSWANNDTLVVATPTETFTFPLD